MSVIHLRREEDLRSFDPQIFSKQTIFTLVHIDHCPWCQRMKGEWSKLSQQPPKEALLITIELPVLERLNRLLKSRDSRDRFGHVRSVPALDLHRGPRRRLPFNGERTAKNMRAFVSKHA